MQKANRAQPLKAQQHRLIEQQEMIRFSDPHCPSSQMLESGACWIRNEAISLETEQHSVNTRH